MTSKEFLDEINQLGNIIVISDKEIIDDLIIQSNLIPFCIEFKNCIFKEKVSFEKIDLNCGLKFINCKFEKILFFIKCTATKTVPTHGNLIYFKESYHIELNETQIEGLYFNGINQIERGIIICNNSIIKNLKVESLSSNNGSFIIKDSTIENQFDVINSDFKNSFEIRSNCIIKSRVRLNNVSTSSLTFTNSCFENDIYIWSGKIRSLAFKNGIFYDNLKISALSIAKDLNINGTEFKKSIIFNIKDTSDNIKGVIKSIFIVSGKFNKQFVIYGDNTEIENVTIRMSKQLEGDIYFNSLKLLKTELSGDNYNSNIVFNLCFFNKLTFSNLYNYSTLSLITAKAYGSNSEIIIEHSNLGKTHLFNVFFNTFDKLSIYNSVMTEIVAANVKWFEPSKLNQNETKEFYDYAQKREIFRQLKFALEKQGNRIDSLIFKSLEIKAYKQELFSTSKWYFKLFNNNRFILWLGKTNNFGLNWYKPVWQILIWVLIFYCLIIIGVSEQLDYNINLKSESIYITFYEFYRYASAFPQLMNPVHTLDKVFTECKNFNFGVQFFDYVLKIFLAFYIFQIISAFRKFTK